MMRRNHTRHTSTVTEATRVLLLPDLMAASPIAPRVTIISFHDTYNTAFMSSVTHCDIIPMHDDRQPTESWVYPRGVMYCPRTGTWVAPVLFRSMAPECTSLTELNISCDWYRQCLDDIVYVEHYGR